MTPWCRSTSRARNRTARPFETPGATNSRKRGWLIVTSDRPTYRSRAGVAQCEGSGDRLLQQRSLGHERQKLLRPQLAGQRPQARPRAAGEDDGEVSGDVVELVADQEGGVLAGGGADVVEVGVREQDAVDIIAVGLEQVGAFLRVVHRLDRAVDPNRFCQKRRPLGEQALRLS